MAEWNTYYREMLRFLTTSGIWFSAFMLAIFLDLKSSTEFAWPIRCMKTQTLRVYLWQKSSCFERSRYRSHAYYNFYQPNIYWFVVCYYSCRLSSYDRFPGGFLVCSRPSEREIVGSNPGRDWRCLKNCYWNGSFQYNVAGPTYYGRWGFPRWLNKTWTELNCLLMADVWPHDITTENVTTSETHEGRFRRRGEDSTARISWSHFMVCYKFLYDLSCVSYVCMCDLQILS